MSPPRWIGPPGAPIVGNSTIKRRQMVVTRGQEAETAQWEQWPDGWRCVRAGIPIAWMVGMAPAEVRKRLARDGWSWEWR